MTVIHILFTSILLLIDKDMVTCNQVLTWYDTQRECASRNETLLENFPSYAELKGNIWIGQYRRISPWIKSYGCFTEESVAEASSTSAYKMRIGSAGFCQEICFSYNRTVFAIKGKECRCLDHSPTEKKVSSPVCDADCYEANGRSDSLYFDECGGDGTYSVFQSGREDESVLGYESSCVAIHCSADSNSTFYFKENCSVHYKPVCNTDVSNSWMESMQLCKSKIPSTEEVFLNNAEKTCKNLNLTDIRWLGVAKEAYNGNDRGAMIREEVKKTFIECMYCNSDGCNFTPCKKPFNGTVFCNKLNREKVEKSSPQTTRLYTSALANRHGNPNTTTQSQMSSKSQTTKVTTIPSPPTAKRSTFDKLKTTTQYMVSSSTKTTNTTTPTSISTTDITTKEATQLNGNKGAFQVFVPIAIAVVVGGIILAIIFTCCCCKKRYQTRVQKHKSRKEVRGSRAICSNVNGIINHTYFSIELKEQGIRSCDVEEKIESPYTHANEETYDHLRDKESKYDKDDNEHTYDSTKSAVAKKEECNENNEGTYDRLGDEKCGTNADDTYHHAFTIRKERYGYDVTEIRKQYILNSLYNQVEIIPNENDTERKSSSNLPEKLKEDHTYFILEQD